MRPRDAFLAGVRLLGLGALLYALFALFPSTIAVLLDRDLITELWFVITLTTIVMWFGGAFFLIVRGRAITKWFYGPEPAEPAVPTKAVTADGAIARLVGLLALLFAISPLATYAVFAIRQERSPFSDPGWQAELLVRGLAFLAFGVVLLIGPSRIGRSLVRLVRGT